MSKKFKILWLPLILMLGVIIVSGFLHYREQNRAEDPRIVDARKRLADYDKLMKQSETDLAFLVLDQVEDIYVNTPGYAQSYELGVVLNNRGSVYLIKAERNLIDNKEVDSESILQAKEFIQKSISIYENWLKKIEPMNQSEIQEMILPHFPEDDFAFIGYDLSKIIDKRVEDIWVSKEETKRRLSVSYTNLGIISRYEGHHEDAMEYYEKALKLWPDNYVTKDNLNRLLGLPPEKRNILQQVFYKNRL